MLNKLTELINGLHIMELKTLQAWKENPKSEIDSNKLLEISTLKEAQQGTAIGWLLSKQILILVGEIKTPIVSLGQKGLEYHNKLIPELRLLSQIKKHNGELTISDLQKQKDKLELESRAIGTAIGSLKKAKAILLDENKSLILGEEEKYKEFNHIQELIKQLKEKSTIPLEKLSKTEQNIINKLSKKRGGSKGIFYKNEQVKRTFALTELGKKVIVGMPEPQEEISQLTPEMLKDGSWKNKRFRKYNISFKPPKPIVGRRNPYREFLDFVQMKLTSMGFEEMHDSFVETEFWNNDALYMPQFHSARGIHDVYMIKQPSHSKEFEGELKEIMERVAATHENGGETNSRGWQYKFDKERTRRLVLRSQGTALSARCLARFLEHNKGKNPNIPGKYFATARVFRPESVDASHLSEFNQTEGIVLGEDITFCDLLGLLKLFAIEVAQAKEFKYAPAYFPFTEPSVELHAKHPKLGWIELGGAGIFRPEVTKPLGIDVPVIAWGLGVDRMGMMALDIDDIRDLFSIDLDSIRNRQVSLY